MHCLSYVQAHHCLTTNLLCWLPGLTPALLHSYRLARWWQDSWLTPATISALPSLLWCCRNTPFISKDSSASLMPSAEAFSCCSLTGRTAWPNYHFITNAKQILLVTERMLWCSILTRIAAVFFPIQITLPILWMLYKFCTNSSCQLMHLGSRVSSEVMTMLARQTSQPPLHWLAIEGRKTEGNGRSGLYELLKKPEAPGSSPQQKTSAASAWCCCSLLGLAQHEWQTELLPWQTEGTNPLNT